MLKRHKQNIFSRVEKVENMIFRAVKLPKFKYYFTKSKAINETSKHVGAPIDLTQVSN